jgi:hypothetical protein
MSSEPYKFQKETFCMVLEHFFTFSTTKEILTFPQIFLSNPTLGLLPGSIIMKNYEEENVGQIRN